jgi:pimeloyl-ACP methyl ester carboxylesterase
MRLPAWMCRFVCIATVSFLTGCSLQDLQTPQRMDKGLVIILPGIEGRSFLNENLARGLDEGGVSMAIEIYDWSAHVPGGFLINIADYERNKDEALRLVERIKDYRHDHPSAAIHIVGHSGGGGLAVMAVERLPKDIRVSSVILLAAAISPTYDLRPALSHSHYGIFNYYSPYDAVFLRIGTNVAGTIDRQHSQAAGAVGFQPVLGDKKDRALYKKLHQIEWNAEMRWASNFGGHTDWTNPPFVRKYLAPLIKDLNGPAVAEAETVAGD